VHQALPYFKVWKKMYSKLKLKIQVKQLKEDRLTLEDHKIRFFSFFLFLAETTRPTA
jgi:hypothetical protein